MTVLITLLASFFIAVLAVIPPGLLNMTAAKISIESGRSKSLKFTYGVCIIVIIQTTIAVMCASYLAKNPGIVKTLQFVALSIFIIISIVFFIAAFKKDSSSIKEKTKKPTNKNHFIHGLGLSTLNMFPIPFQAYMSLTIATLGWLNFNIVGMITYIIGTTIGTFSTIYLYIVFFNKINSKKLKSTKTMNLLIGSITAIIAVITGIKLLSSL